MVRFSLALLALCATALAATAHNDRRGLQVLAESHFIGRDAPLMDLDRRQVQKQDSPEIQKLKDERKAISPELDQASQALRDASKAADAAIPEDLKQKEEAAFQKFNATRQGLPENKKDQLKKNAEAIQAQKEKEKASASAPVAVPAPSAPA
ncbi:Endonuclease/exonuclease/phosphatase [Purpureocillium lavendulum]|uniref:Endonuclease/exonuclease/phosphatase n=1 Tax=Purpureocillium lavendulum TaxID=1247861 RepID=A0AB34FB18_9HYPO|nr:Endonuclease/exonuclease/phosphatase [Purpureocillium lavendulum]